ncbi:hypothetical protein KBD59_02355 [Candidatus Gracilibacteria bacterium]|nr:hypothetical protein [Candidatus Gracilibacteria bacterium]
MGNLDDDGKVDKESGIPPGRLVAFPGEFRARAVEDDRRFAGTDPEVEPAAVVTIEDIRNRKNIEVEVMFLRAFAGNAFALDPENEMRGMGFRMLGSVFGRLVEKVQPGSDDEKFLQKLERQDGIFKRAATVLQVTTPTIEPAIHQFLDRLGVVVTPQDTAAVLEEMRTKSKNELDQRRADIATDAVLGWLKDDGVRDIGSAEMRPMIENILAIVEREAQPNASPIDKAMPREWLVSNIEGLLREKPDVADTIWKVLGRLWAHYGLEDLGGVQSDVCDRLGLPSERKARRNVGYSAQWLNDIASGYRDEATVMEWMLAAYRRDFEGDNAAFGQFNIYLDELRQRVARYNEVAARSVGDEEGGQDVASPQIDPFFVERVRTFFRKNGVEL